MGRDSGTTAGYVSLDLRLNKRFRIGKRGAADLILDVFNALNPVNFFENTNQSSFTIFGTGAFPGSPLPTFGRYTETLPPRQVQLAVKVSI